MKPMSKTVRIPTAAIGDKSISVTDLRVLAIALSFVSRPSIYDISDVLGLAPKVISESVDRLKKRGYLDDDVEGAA